MFSVKNCVSVLLVLSYQHSFALGPHTSPEILKGRQEQREKDEVDRAAIHADKVEETTRREPSSASLPDVIDTPSPPLPRRGGREEPSEPFSPVSEEASQAPSDLKEPSETFSPVPQKPSETFSPVPQKSTETLSPVSNVREEPSETLSPVSNIREEPSETLSPVPEEPFQPMSPGSVVSKEPSTPKIGRRKSPSPKSAPMTDISDKDHPALTPPPPPIVQISEVRPPPSFVVRPPPSFVLHPPPSFIEPPPPPSFIDPPPPPSFIDSPPTPSFIDPSPPPSPGRGRDRHTVHPTRAPRPANTARPVSFVKSVGMKERNTLLVNLNIHLSRVSSIYVEYFPRKPEEHPNVPRLRTKTYEGAEEYSSVALMRLYEQVEYQVEVFEVGDPQVQHTEYFRTRAIDTFIRRKAPQRLDGIPTYDFTYTARDGPAYHYIYDNTGQIVWYLERRGLPGDAIVRKDDNNTVIISQEGTIMEYNPEGDIVTEVIPGCHLTHHSISLQPDDQNILFTAARERVVKDSPELDEYDYRFRHDQADDTILRIDLEKGTYEEVVQMRDYFDMGDDRTSFSDHVSDITGFFASGCENGTANDWIRLNSVYCVNETYLIIGSHHFEEGFGFSKDYWGDWHLEWRLGSNEHKSDFTWIDETDKFYGEHEIIMLPNENLLVYDNGIGRPLREGGWYSRGLELELDFEDMTVQAVWQFSLNVSELVDLDEWEDYDFGGEEKDEKKEEEEVEDCSEFVLGLCVSSHRGSMQRLENGNTMIVFLACYCDPSQRTYITEVNHYGELVSLMIQEHGGSTPQDSGIIKSVGTEIVV